ncbi:MAG: phenylacetic acid degradation operon negative regulatory protein [Candidatus Berkelbacteria bacterium Athens1014_28]|uniref:Phenylacetic acid degradation operon negative regulatory protein n=1 Tax=Candidatus Berkelbacteria bacterium Athens1014_28 TaxID=2017145 RepID=A0A554LK40_9BACT|nr:MAG: phenylacetic acid degradation operon negative regulatory protein [Candidatus Berkelbacteria bacterium Athens1014_28]
MKKNIKKEKIKETSKVIVKAFGEITLDILQVVARTPEALADAFLNHHSASYLFDTPEFYSDRLFDNIRSLIDRKYIKIVEKEGQKSIELTNKAKIKLLENSKDNIVDGKWRMLSFDIPEKIKNRRNQFRRSIKRVGFKQAQKSLWVSPFIKADQIELIINELDIRQYVAYIIAEKTDIDKHLRKLFADQL